MFQPDDETPEYEPCTVEQEFRDLLIQWDRTEDGHLDMHTLQHMVGFLLLQLRHQLVAIDVMATVVNMVHAIEASLIESDYMLTYPSGRRRADLPEFRAGIEHEVGSVDIPDAIPDWLTQSEEGEEE